MFRQVSSGNYPTLSRICLTQKLDNLYSDKLVTVLNFDIWSFLWHSHFAQKQKNTNIIFIYLVFHSDKFYLHDSMWIYSFFLVQDWICWGRKPEIIDPHFICLHASFFNYHKNSQPKEGQFGLLSICCRLIYFSIEEAKISCFLELERLCAGLVFS